MTYLLPISTQNILGVANRHDDAFKLSVFAKSVINVKKTQALANLLPAIVSKIY